MSCLSSSSSRHAPCREPINPYYVNTGYAMAPATSAYDSEQQSMSSDADTISLTDSSVYVSSHPTRRHLMHFIYVVIPGHEGCAWLHVWHKYSQSLFRRKVCHISRKLWVIWLENYTSCQCLPAPAHDNRSLKSHLLISQTSESFKNWSVMQIRNPMKSLSADIKPCPIECAELKPLTHWPLLQMLP